MEEDCSSVPATGMTVRALTADGSSLIKISLPRNKKSSTAAIKKNNRMVIFRFINSGSEPDKEAHWLYF